MRRWQWIAILLLTLAVIGLPLAWFGWGVWNRSRLDGELAAIADSGAPVDWQDVRKLVFPDPAAPRSNALVTPLLQEIDQWQERKSPTWFDGLDQVVSEDWGRVIADLESVSGPLDQLEEALRTAPYRREPAEHPFFSDAFSDLPATMAAVRLYLARAVLELEAGDTESARQSLRTAHDLSPGRASLTLVDSLVGLACEESLVEAARAAIKRPKIGVDQLVEAFDPFLAAGSATGGWVKAVELERAAAVTLYQDLISGNVGPEVADLGHLSAWWLRPFMVENARWHLHVMRRVLELRDQSYPELGPALTQLEAEIGEARVIHTLAQTIFPAVRMIPRTSTIGASRNRLARLALAALAHHAAEGTWPESLDQLALPGGVAPPLDPLTELPYLLETTPEGELVISSPAAALDALGAPAIEGAEELVWQLSPER